MITAAVTMVRDEADIIETTVRHMLTQVDVVIVADNRSVDGTREILDSLPGALPLGQRQRLGAGKKRLGGSMIAGAEEAVMQRSLC